ncbi:hypothetical protein [Mesorhizobium sp. M7A.F.Ca.CA.002.12.1.1]|uniref:hypothetical protein n=1 Tax=Mesorhizobium sp. M7A.F.Ca.CA.002.12.1.1 TaxID=2496735 RepID=UPI000FCAF64D|nr:hypothetical protein [Mesorhizobium sp. M7A.F.Ca.CA.002.12.1.1]RUX60129.1 hypothetical protein EN989_10950 [Mesorhizobium sp. M7A.F.Ca.CA.002.12.1.1]
MVYVELDIDIWRYGRDASGHLNHPWLCLNYPNVGLRGTKFEDELTPLAKILKEHFEPDFNDQYPFLIRFGYVFFQNKEDAEFFRGLLYVY